MRLKLTGNFSNKIQKFGRLVLVTVLIIFISFIPIRLTLTRLLIPTPQAIFALGGDLYRMKIAAQTWHSSHLPIWVSDAPKIKVYYTYALVKEGVPKSAIHYDGCATDTVTNFTCTVDIFAKKKFWHLYLVTSDYHMARARIIATFVFGSRGIVVTPVSVPSQGKLPDSKWRMIRDGIRSVIWLVTGRTGASFNPRLYEEN
jgi:uncharacterized SAM-binding protein YcdF (DUF218 family)